MSFQKVLIGLSKYRFLPLLLGISNSLLGCALGVFYSELSLETFVETIFILLASLGIQGLFYCAADYTKAYQKYKNNCKKRIFTPITVWNFPLNKLRKIMALLTVFTAFFGACAMYMAVGYDLQMLSWMIFFITISILSAIFYSMMSMRWLKWLGAIAIFGFFGIISIMGSQMLILLTSSQEALDIYPDTWLLAFSVGLQSLLVSHVAYMRSLKEEAQGNKISLMLLFGKPVSFIYIITLTAASIIISIAACIYSHRAWEISLLIFTFIGFIVLVALIIKNADESNLVRMLDKKLLFCSSSHNLLWTLLLIIDYYIYNS